VSDTGVSEVLPYGCTAACGEEQTMSEFKVDAKCNLEVKTLS